MKGKTKKIVLAVAVIGAVAAGGFAFTASNTVPDSVAGYGTSDVSGATATSVVHNLSADGTHILSTDLVLTGDQTANTVQAGFDNDALTTCDAPVLAGSDSTVHCVWDPTGTPPGHSTDTGADHFAVAVTGPSS